MNLYFWCAVKSVSKTSHVSINRFFSGVSLPPSDKPVLKIPSKLKEAIKNAKEQMEKRLKEEQKIVSVMSSFYAKFSSYPHNFNICPFLLICTNLIRFVGLKKPNKVCI